MFAGSFGPSLAAIVVVSSTRPVEGLRVWLSLLLGGPLGEEFGWRGFALPAMQDRLGWRAAGLGLGLVWGVWHLPLFFIDGTAQAHIPPVLFLLSVVAMSIVFAWLANRSAGSVVAALVFHTAINYWPSVVPVLPTEASYRAYLGTPMPADASAAAQADAHVCLLDALGIAKAAVMGGSAGAP
jgi:membrane protease YdiL (CAAX protease family)